MKRTRFTVASVLAGLAGSALSSTALAHGGIPRVASFAFEPGNPAHVFLQSQYYGGFVTRDGGRTWGFVPTELISGESSSTRFNPVVVLPGGKTLVAAGFDGLAETSDGFCNVTRTQSVPTASMQGADVGGVYDITTSPDGSVVYILTVTGTGQTPPTIDSHFWRSTDGGVTFAPLGSSPPEDVSPLSFAVAPSAPSVLYATAMRIRLSDSGLGDAGLLRSFDAGQHWDVVAAPFSLDEGRPRLAAIDPSDPDVLFVASDLDGTWNYSTPTSVWMSPDRGASWQLLKTGTASMPALAQSPDGRTVVFGGPSDGVFSASVAALKSGASNAVTQVSAERVWSFAWTASGLYAGADEYKLNGVSPGATVSVSHDGGHTFTRVMGLCDVTPLSCSAGSMANDYGFDFDHFQSDLQTPLCSQPGGTGPSGSHADAGPPVASDAGTGVATGSGGSSATAPDVPSGGAAADSDPASGPEKKSSEIQITGGCSTHAGARTGGGALALVAAALVSLRRRLLRARR